MIDIIKFENDVIILGITNAVVNFLILKEEYKQIKEIQEKQLVTSLFKFIVWFSVSYTMCMFSEETIIPLLYNYVAFRICVIFSLFPYHIQDDKKALFSVLTHVTSSIILFTGISNQHMMTNFIVYLSIYPVVYTGSLYFLCNISHKSTTLSKKNDESDITPSSSYIDIHLTVMR